MAGEAVERSRTSVSFCSTICSFLRRSMTSKMTGNLSTLCLKPSVRHIRDRSITTSAVVVPSGRRRRLRRRDARDRREQTIDLFTILQPMAANTRADHLPSSSPPTPLMPSGHRRSCTSAAVTGNVGRGAPVGAFDDEPVVLRASVRAEVEDVVAEVWAHVEVEAGRHDLDVFGERTGDDLSTGCHDGGTADHLVAVLEAALGRRGHPERVLVGTGLEGQEMMEHLQVGLLVAVRVDDGVLYPKTASSALCRDSIR